MVFQIFHGKRARDENVHTKGKAEYIRESPRLIDRNVKRHLMPTPMGANSEQKIRFSRVDETRGARRSS